MRRISDLPTLAEVQATRRALPKHAAQTRKAAKGKAKRAEKKQVQAVRPQCVARDGHCRLATLALGDMAGLNGPHVCQGPSEWAHMGGKRRARTRGQAPEQRHGTPITLMLCKRAHDQYDGRARPRLEIEQLTPRGADGPLMFKEGKR